MPPSLRFPVVLFDLGSTLIYFDGDWPEVAQEGNLALLHSLHQSGLNLDGGGFLEQFKIRLDAYFTQRETEFIEQTTAYILRNLLTEGGYPDIPETVLLSALEAFYAASQAHWQLEADALPTLQALRTAGYRLGMISNASDDADVQRLVDNTDLRPFFDIILTSAALGTRKPQAPLFQAALAHWGVQPAQAAMVGDMLSADILGAQNAGLFAIWITRRADTPANQAYLDTIIPDAVIQTLDELPELLARI